MHLGGGPLKVIMRRKALGVEVREIVVSAYDLRAWSLDLARVSRSRCATAGRGEECCQCDLGPCREGAVECAVLVAGRE